jgi:hypothetical protein
MCHHEIGQYELDLERRRDATTADADEPGFGTEAAEDDPDPEEPTVVSADD